MKPIELWAIARAIVGLEWSQVGTAINPMLRQQLLNVKKETATTLLTLLGPEISQQVLAMRPDSPPPLAERKEAERLTIPELPPTTKLTDEALKAAETVGKWSDEFLAWSVKRTPMTPSLFLEAGGIWTIGLAIARRCSLNLNFTSLYPHLYIMWIARTSIYKKSTGMYAIIDLISEAFPHLLLPEEQTPEALISALGGKKPENYDSLNNYEKGIDDLGRRYAAQRGILLDEASALFGAAKRDYMQGLPEMFMRLYDAPRRYVRSLNSKGKIVIRNASLSVLGASTPGAMKRNTDASFWETGEFARYVLLIPDKILPYDLGSGDNIRPPDHLVQRIKRLHQALPTPPDDLSMMDQTPPEQSINQVQIAPDAFNAYSAYAKAVTYDMLLSERLVDRQLHPNYSRLHIQALKVAINLAAIDWADGDSKGSIRISLGHWAKAQLITEKWRESMHRLVHTMNVTTDDEAESIILNHLGIYADGETLRDLGRRTHLDRKSITDALKVLKESGLVAEEQTGRTTVYKLN